MTAFDPKLALDLDFIGSPGETSPIRTKCITCSRWLDKGDITIGSCPYCLEDKAKSTSEYMREYDSSKQEYPQCFECNTEICLVGLRTWDTLAKSWKLLCTTCGEKQIKKDSQYTNTPWGYQNKLR